MADPNDWSWLYGAAQQQQAAAEAQRAQQLAMEQEQARQLYTSPQYQQDFFNQTGATTNQAASSAANSISNWNLGGDPWTQQQAQAAMAEGSRTELQSRAQLDAQIAQQQQAQANNQRYGSDLSWLDPSFQRDPALLGSSAGAQAYADPATIQAQQNAYSGMQQLAGTPMQWQSPAQQQQMFDQWGGVASGQGAPTFMGNGQQAGIMSGLQGLSAPDWTGSGDLQMQAFNEIGSSYQPQYRSEADQVSAMNALRSNNSAQQQQWLGAIGANNSDGQQSWLNAIRSNNSAAQQDAIMQLGSNNSWQQDQWAQKIGMNNSQQQTGVFNKMQDLYNSGGKQGLDWDDGSRQNTQYGHLQEIIDGGGATAIEMANRQTQRADQEQWLRSQREADMQDYAERGLTGSGQELLSLSADRQSAAGRNSIADLQTAAQLEQRRLGAIGMSSDLAGQMRGQTYQEQALEANRTDQALYASGDMANNIRGMDLQRDVAGGQLATQTRSLDQQRDLGLVDAQNAVRSMDLQRDVSGGALASDIRGMDLQRDIAGGQLSSQIRGMDLSRDQAVGDMANALRSNAYQEQSFLAQNSLNQAVARGGLATDMRGQNFQEQSFNANYDLNNLSTQAQLAGQMRGQTFDENSYLDQRTINAMAQQTNLANTMRGQTFNEQSFARDNQSQLYGQMGSLSTNMRNSSFNEAYSRGSAADQFAQLNQQAINQASSQNTQFLQNSYQNMMGQRQQWEMNVLNQGLDAATASQLRAQREQQYGFGQGTQLGTNDAEALNRAREARNAALSGTAIMGGQQDLANQIGETKAVNDLAAKAGAETIGFITQAGAGMPSTGGAAPSGGSAPVSGAPLSSSGTTWAGGGAPIAGKWDPNRFRTY